MMLVTPAAAARAAAFLRLPAAAMPRAYSDDVTDQPADIGRGISQIAAGWPPCTLATNLRLVADADGWRDGIVLMLSPGGRAPVHVYGEVAG